MTTASFPKLMLLRTYMGDEKRMDYNDQTITLYSSQADPVLRALEKDGVCYSKAGLCTKEVRGILPDLSDGLQTGMSVMQSFCTKAGTRRVSLLGVYRHL